MLFLIADFAGITVFPTTILRDARAALFKVFKSSSRLAISIILSFTRVRVESESESESTASL